jgi:hypothetical protein
MTVAIEAIPSEDTEAFTYLAFKYDTDFFSDVYENLTQIKKEKTLTFSLENNFFTIISGSYHTLRKRLSIPNIEKDKFSIKEMELKHTPNVYPLEYCQLHIENNYFYFTAYTFKAKKKVEFQSVNFDRAFIENLRNKCN